MTPAPRRWPLTSAQRGVWFAHELDPANPALTTAEVVELVGSVEVDRLREAHAAAYAEFPLTRARFVAGEEGPEQWVQEVSPDLTVVECRDVHEAAVWVDACLARPMDLATGDTVRAALLRWQEPDGTPHAWWWHAAHHVVLDGYGAQHLLRRIAEWYSDPTRPALADVPGPAELVAEERTLDEPAARDWWRGRLEAYSGCASLAGRSASASPRALRVVRDFDAAEQKALKEGARRLGVPWTDLLLAATGSYLARMAGLDGIRVGLPLMNRTVPGRPALASSRTVCTAVNVVPVTVPAAGTVEELLRSVVREQEEVRRRPFVRHEDLARWLVRRDPGAQLFGAQVNVVPFEQELTLTPEDGHWLVGRIRNVVAGPVDDLTVTFRGTPGRGRRFRLEWDANPALHEEAELDWHLERLVAWVLTTAGAEPGDEVAALPLLPEAERRVVVEQFNATSHVSSSATLAERFRAQAQHTPDATALVSGAERRTYAQLLAAAERVAAGLAAEGVGPRDVVGVALERGPALLEVVHGVVLLGAVYLPLDPDLPPARLHGMVEDAGVVRVIEPGTVPDAPPRDDLGGPGLDDPAYLLFTSGSTGRPKGVVVNHRAIDNRLAWQQHHLPIGPGDTVLHKTPISFDVSVWELFWAFQQGATLVVAAPGEHRDPRALAETLTTHAVDVLHFVPSMLRAFVADPVARETVAGHRVRHVVTSGEALTPDLVEACRDVLGVAPTNLYGPTEAAVDVTVWDCTGQEDPVPIGRPVWNTRCLVLDAEMRPLPIGVAGELWLGGVQLADGYHGRPDLTAERFVPDPSRAGHRLYRTGDVAAWRADGALRYLGRADDQVKVRGQRVELGEVENALAAVPGAAALAAGTLDDAVGGQRLVVWFSVVAGADSALVQTRLGERAAQVLPPAWLPHDWVEVTEIPVGTTGKTDRRRLASEHAPTRRHSAAGRPPQDLDEQRWCALMSEVLGTAVLPEEDFFALGGDSLRVLRLLAAAHEEFAVDLRLADIFAHPTAARLARLLREGTPGDEVTASRTVVTLRRPPGEPRAHLFVLPPAGGLGWCYTSWLRGLPQDVAVHAVQAPGIEEGKPEPVADLEALARRQLESIVEVAGEAPFHLAGWSLGGMAAHAVAALARAKGLEVGSVVLVDAYPSEQWRHLAEPTEQGALAGVLRLGGVEPPLGADGLPRALDRAGVVELLRRSGSAVGSLPPSTIAGCIASVVEAAGLVRRSVHPVLDGNVTVVVAGAPRPETWLDPRGWADHVTGRVRTVVVEARHEQLVQPPHALEVAAAIAAEWG